MKYKIEKEIARGLTDNYNFDYYDCVCVVEGTKKQAISYCKKLFLEDLESLIEEFQLKPDKIEDFFPEPLGSYSIKAWWFEDEDNLIIKHHFDYFLYAFDELNLDLVELKDISIDEIRKEFVCNSEKEE